MGIMWGIGDRERPPSGKPLPSRKPREPLPPVDASKVAAGYWVVSLANVITGFAFLVTFLAFYVPLLFVWGGDGSPPPRWFSPVFLAGLVLFSTGLILLIVSSPLPLHRVLSALTLAFAFVEMAVLIADILGRISQKENYSLLLEFALLLPVTLTFALGSCWFCREAGMTDERKAWSITAGLLALAPILVAGWILLGLNACSMLLAIADILVATFLFAIASFSTSVAAGRHQTELKENASAAPAEPFPGKDAS